VDLKKEHFYSDRVFEIQLKKPTLDIEDVEELYEKLQKELASAGWVHLWTLRHDFKDFGCFVLKLEDFELGKKILAVSEKIGKLTSREMGGG
jgi:hypothetical protein